MECSYSVMSLVWLPWHIRLLYKGWSNDAAGVHMACVYASYYIFFQTAFLRRDWAERVFMTVSQTCVSCILLCPPSLWRRGTCFRTAEAPWQLQPVSHISIGLRVKCFSVGDPGHHCGTQRSHTLVIWISKALYNQTYQLLLHRSAFEKEQGPTH